MGANVVLATAKITAGALGHSYVLIADGIESALDIAGSAIIWGGLKFAARPADETHPYGHGKAEPLAAIMVSLGVLAAALVSRGAECAPDFPAAQRADTLSPSSSSSSSWS